MANIINNLGQVLVGFRSPVLVTPPPSSSSLWTSIYSVYNADSVGSSSLKTSLVAAYNGESNANDSFGTNNGTAVGGLTYTTGKIGNAFSFNGSNSYVSLPNNSLNPSGDFSISFWVKFNSVAATYINLIENYYNPSFNSRYGFNMYLQSGKIRFATYDGSITNIAQSTTTFVVNQWYQIILSKKINTAPKLYVNGLNETFTQLSGNISNNPVYNSLCKSLFGVDFDYSVSYNSYLNGSLDAINIWNKELTASEVTELYNSGNGAQYIGDNFYKPTTNDALNTYNGTAQGGLTYEVGKVGTAFTFNGTNAFIKYPANSMSFTGDFSISVWVNIPSGYIGTNEIDLLTNITMPYWYNSPKGFWFRTVGGSLYFSLSNGTTSDGVVWNDSQGLIIKGNSGWINIVATRKSSTRSNLYVNGVLKASNTSTFNPSYSPTNQTPSSGGLYILNSAGVVQQNTVFAPNGTKIDEVNVWNKELTATEITELYNSGNGKQYPN